MQPSLEQQAGSRQPGTGAPGVTGRRPDRRHAPLDTEPDVSQLLPAPPSHKRLLGERYVLMYGDDDVPEPAPIVRLSTSGTSGQEKGLDRAGPGPLHHSPAAEEEEEEEAPSVRATPEARRASDVSFVSGLIARAEQSKSSLLSSVAEALQSCVSSMTLGLAGGAAGGRLALAAAGTQGLGGGAAGGRLSAVTAAAWAHAPSDVATAWAPAAASPAASAFLAKQATWSEAAERSFTSTYAAPATMSGVRSRRNNLASESGNGIGPGDALLSQPAPRQRSSRGTGQSPPSPGPPVRLIKPLALAPPPAPRPSSQRQQQQLQQAQQRPLVLRPTRVPSMSFPKWRQVPAAVRRALLRVNSPGFRLDQMKGYSDR